MKGIQENFSLGCNDIKPPGLRVVMVRAALPGFARDNEKGTLVLGSACGEG